MRMIGVLVFGFLLALGATGSLAEEGGHESHESQSGAHEGMASPPSGMRHGMDQKGTEMGHSGMQQGMGMHAMHEQMQALHDHSKTMEGISDQRKLMEEMKKHMQMMDEMMEQMMQSNMAAASRETPSETP